MLCFSTSFIGYSQSESSAVHLAGEPEGVAGSARYQSMAGSMGAMGADYSATNINPASIGIFRNEGKLSFTFSLRNAQESALWYANKAIGKRDLSPRFDEISYMSSWKKSVGVGLSYGFAYQRIASFDRNISVLGNMNGQGSSFADYVAGTMNRSKGDRDVSWPNSTYTQDGAYADNPWLFVLGVRNGWVNSVNGEGYTFFSNYRANENSDLTAGLSANYDLREKGYLDRYGFSLSFTPQNNLNMGLSFNVMSLKNSLNASFFEEHRPDNDNNKENLLLENSIYSTGAGIELGFGIIYEFVSGFRLGAALYTPTYYTITQDFYARAKSNVAGNIHEDTTPNDGGTKFSVNGPLRFTISTAYVFGKRALVNLDYQASLLNTVRLSYYDEIGSSDVYRVDNSAIKEDFSVRHNIRLGAEINATNRLAFRAGLAYATSGINKDLLNGDRPTREIFVDGLAPSYTLLDYVATFATGLGYKLTPHWAIDFALSYNSVHSKVFAFPTVSDPGFAWASQGSGTQASEEYLQGYAPIRYTNGKLSGAISLSYRF